jgi:dienelactone hydrolase
MTETMTDRITIEGRDRAFGAHIARPKVLPAPAVVVLHEVFGVNADIRKTCDELAEQGFIAVAPDLFWRQEPGVDLGVTSEADWQHGLRLYQAIRASITPSLAIMGHTYNAAASALANGRTSEFLHQQLR